jgi:MinD superfamily P-loop ATPase
MIISVASGKGGTGKTTIATNLAMSMGRSVNLIDCDVEEPNAHLFIKPGSITRTIATTFVPRIDTERCTGCRACAELCQFNALTVVGGCAMVFAELCHSCRGCYEICAEAAVREDFRELGEMISGYRDQVRLTYGSLRVGEAMAPPLIKQVIAAGKDDNPTIIDAPPGTSCPMITAVNQSDFVLFVSEPTPFGLHDLTLAHETVKNLGLPCGMVINRCDIGDEGLRNYAHEQNLPVLLEIPFDRAIAEAYARGILLIDHDQSWRKRFLTLYADIAAMMSQPAHTP